MLDVKKLRVEYLENPVGIGERKPRFSWVVESNQKNVLQTSYQIQVSEKGAGFYSPLWDSGSVASDCSIHISYAGQALSSRTGYDYRVRITDNHGNESPWSETSYFETGVLDPKEWCADFITPAMVDTSNSSKCPYLRREFEVTKKISTARIYATSLGLYELHINGQAVDEVLFTPGWTSYHHRLQYQTYDVTEKLNTGLNTVGAILGSGWYNGDLTWNNARNFYGENIALFVQLHIYFEDGSEQVITSDESWKTAYGPILFSEIYHGEIYDAREDIPGWDLPGYDDTSWKEIKRLDIDKTILTAQDGVFVKRIETVKPIGIIKTPESETVIDMGQNMVGRIRFQVEGPRGSKVVLKHAEVLDKDGNFYTENLRSAKQTVEYILKGSGVETFEPHFTFQGFRYVKLEEYPGEPALKNFTGIVIHSDMKKTGNFTCSNDLLNQLQHNILWGQKGNFLDVPTDCPQRDERLGWTGDAQVFIRTACFNMDVAAFFRKWLRDLKADQYEGGGLPHVIPDVLYNRNGSSSGWGDAAVICPWTLYLCYGDMRILEEQYESMKSWVEYIRSKAENGLLWNSGSHFGDWLGLDAKEGSCKGATAEDLISTAFYVYSTELLAKTAKLLGNMEDFTYYSQLHGSIKKAYQDEFITPSGRLAVPTQTAHVLSLMFGLVPEKYVKRVSDSLVKYLENADFHLTTGFLGTPYLCHVLSENGQLDAAYRLLLQTDYPSWLYQITKGATTIWEHWDGIKPDGTFWSADMNSYNHYAYGAIGDWMYRIIAGINMDEANPGYKHILITPRPGGNLSFASAELDTMYGTVKSSWKIDNGKMRMEVLVPHNTKATVVLPGAKREKMSDKDLHPTDFEQITETESGLCLELGSGYYTFEYVI